jgi:hypothetical protein
MVAPGKLSVNAAKKDRERDTSTFAKGGKGGANRMLEEVPAEPAPRGRTGPTSAKAPGSLHARGGPRQKGFSVSLPAVGGHCAPIHKGR